MDVFVYVHFTFIFKLSLLYVFDSFLYLKRWFIPVFLGRDLGLTCPKAPIIIMGRSAVKYDYNLNEKYIICLLFKTSLWLRLYCAKVTY